MPKPKGAGDLRDRLIFQRRIAPVEDGYGNTKAGWAELGRRSASVTPTRGGEEVQAARVAGVGAFDCWVRSDSMTRALTTEDRAVDARDASRTFNIVWGPQDMDGRREWLLIQLRQGGADG